MNQNKQYIKVVFPSKLRSGFTYEVPENFTTPLQPGQRVVVPLHNIKKVGFIVDISDQEPTEFKTKPITEIIDQKPIIPAEMFEFLKKLSSYYLAPLGKTLAAAIPSEFQMQKKRHLYLTGNRADVPDKYHVIYQIVMSKPDGVLFTEIHKHFSAALINEAVDWLKRKNLISESPEFIKPEPKIHREKEISLSGIIKDDELEKIKNKAPRQYEILTFLQRNRSKARQDKIRHFSTSAMKSLADKGLININYIDVTYERLWSGHEDKHKHIDLNKDQVNAFETVRDALATGNYSPFLLRGVTGSGKTEVYIRLIQSALDMNKSAIILVPEITLTTHLATRFRTVFGENIAIWHSNLTTPQRDKIWRSVLSGDIPVIIGARSALFLPMKSLGLIIVDEEHDSSFKQKDPDPRYNARDAALLRASLCNATVLLGSATPSIESLYNGLVGKLSRLDLPKKYSKSAPPIIHVVDMIKEYKKVYNKKAPISSFLINKIKEKTEKGEQVLLLQNRRGYSNVILCASCGWTPKCTNCDISMTYHKIKGKMVCHYCGHETPPPKTCPKCFNKDFLYPGHGTQKVEDELRENFPDLKVARLDIDTARKKNYTKNLLNDFDNGKIQVIIGTQMIAKGLDFHNVSLVGVLNADIGLFMPDFRARERVFQLLYQVSGRAGRGSIQGEVILQTFNVNDFTIQAAIQQDLEKFVNFEYHERNPMNYPPFGRIALLLISDLNYHKAEQVAGEVVKFLKKDSQRLNILGPAPAPIARIKNRFRFIIILKSRKEHDGNGTFLRNHIANFVNSKEYQRLSRQARVSVDIDPLDLL